MAFFLGGFGFVAVARCDSALHAPVSALAAPAEEPFNGAVKTSCGTYSGVPVPNKTDPGCRFLS